MNDDGADSAADVARTNRTPNRERNAGNLRLNALRGRATRQKLAPGFRMKRHRFLLLIRINQRIRRNSAMLVLQSQALPCRALSRIFLLRTVSCAQERLRKAGFGRVEAEYKQRQKDAGQGYKQAN